MYIHNFLYLKPVIQLCNKKVNLKEEDKSLEELLSFIYTVNCK